MRRFLERLGLGEYFIVVLFGLALLAGDLVGAPFALGVGGRFWMFFSEMIAFLPLMFILIGVIDVWFPKETVERHIGEGSGVLGLVWVIALAMLQAGPLYGAFPVAYLLWKKGARVRNIFVYLGAFSTMKLPMLTFEIGFLGLKFSLLRTLFTLPVFILIGSVMEAWLKDRGFEMKSP